ACRWSPPGAARCRSWSATRALWSIPNIPMRSRRRSSACSPTITMPPRARQEGAREHCGHPTGVGRNLGGLLHEWAAMRGLPHEFVLYAHEATSLPLDTRRFATRLVPGSPGTWWEQVSAPRAAARDHLDVWFAPGYTAPLRLQVPTVVAIHDLSFVAHPEWFGMREGARRRWLTAQSAALAAAILTIS